MRTKTLPTLLAATITSLAILTFAPASLADSKALQAAIGAKHRADSAARDPERRPLETLTFFEVEPDMTVVEIWPGAAGWYTEILAPYLREDGKLYAAQFDAEHPVSYYKNSYQAFMKKMDSAPAIYDAVEVTTFDPPTKLDIAPANSVDRVLTFRNVHNWYMRGGGDAKVTAAFGAFYKALKPGGILGVVDHRLPADRDLGDQEASGYMKQDYVIKMAEAAGFKLVEASEINANPKDKADHASGVWTLPPSYRLGDKDRERYKAIGESDRMTLKFVKPE